MPLKTIHIKTSFIAATITSMSFFSSPPVQSAELLINQDLPPKHPFYIGFVYDWIKEVTAATKGAVTPKFSTARLGPPPKNWQTVNAGVADVVLLANLFQKNRIILPRVADLPLSSTTSVKTSQALWGTHEKFFDKADEFKPNKLIASFSLTASVIHSRKKPIRTVADLKNFKLRSSPGLATQIFTDLGAVPVAAGPSKLFGLISKGVVDGIAVPANGLTSFRLTPYIKYTTLIPGGVTNASFSMIINGKKWDGLTKEQQSQVMSVSGMHISNKLAIGDTVSNEALAKLKELGGQVIEPGPDLLATLKKFAEKEEGLWVKAANAKGVDGKAALAYYKSKLK